MTITCLHHRGRRRHRNQRDDRQSGSASSDRLVGGRPGWPRAPGRWRASCSGRRRPAGWSGRDHPPTKDHRGTKEMADPRSSVLHVVSPGEQTRGLPDEERPRVGRAGCPADPQGPVHLRLHRRAHHPAVSPRPALERHWRGMPGGIKGRVLIVSLVPHPSKTRR